MTSLRTKLLLGVLGCALLGAMPGRAQGGGHQGGGGQSGGQGGGRQGGGRQDMPGGMGQPGGMGSQPGVGGYNNHGGRGGIPPEAGTGRRMGLPGGGNGSSQTGPVGRWWDDKHYASTLGLRPDQKKRMDAIFNGNRGELTDRVQTLRQEESRLEAATRDTRLSQESIFGQMDRVAQARDALEKVTARLLESLKKELDQDQAGRIETLK